MATPTEETVTAADIEEGNKVFFPNSRHAQPVTSIDVIETNTKHQRRIHADRVSWLCNATSTVRREVPA